MSDPIPPQFNVIPFTPTSLEKLDPKPVFWITVPTPTQRDSLASSLYRAGAVEVTQEFLRATMIDDLYNHYPEEQAEEHAQLLDGFWQTHRADELAFAAWHEQEIERQKDVAAGAPDLGPAPQPIKVTPHRTKARAQLLVHEITEKSPRVQALMQRRLEFGKAQDTAMMRLHIVKVDNMPALAGVRVALDGMLPTAHVEQIRNAITDAAWRELMAKIDGGYSLSEEEEKNSVSPLGSSSDPSGLPAQSDDSANSDGKWTDSSIEPLPPAESAPTIV